MIQYRFTVIPALGTSASGTAGHCLPSSHRFAFSLAQAAGAWLNARRRHRPQSDSESVDTERQRVGRRAGDSESVDATLARQSRGLRAARSVPRSGAPRTEPRPASAASADAPQALLPADPRRCLRGAAADGEASRRPVTAWPRACAASKQRHALSAARPARSQRPGPRHSVVISGDHATVWNLLRIGVGGFRLPRLLSGPGVTRRWPRRLLTQWQARAPPRRSGCPAAGPRPEPRPT